LPITLKELLLSHNKIKEVHSLKFSSKKPAGFFDSNFGVITSFLNVLDLSYNKLGDNQKKLFCFSEHQILDARKEPYLCFLSIDGNYSDQFLKKINN
jgi:hypothetical protein